MNAHVSEDAHAGWVALAESCGASVTSLLEVMGRWLHSGRALDMAAICAEARAETQEQRRRPK